MDLKTVFELFSVPSNRIREKEKTAIGRPIGGEIYSKTEEMEGN